MKKSKSKEKGVRVILPFVVIILLIFLMVVSLSWEEITKFFARLGIVPLVEIMEFPPTEFTYTIPSSDLRAGRVVGYFSNATDTSGNPNATVTKTFKVIYPENVNAVQILDASYIPVTQINKGSDFFVRVTINNSRLSDVDAWIIFQVLDPNGDAVEPLTGVSQYSHTPGVVQTIDKSYSTTSDNFFVGNGYTAEVRVFNQTWGVLGGFKICTTRSATFDIKG